LILRKPSVIGITTQLPLSVYIHLPWCLKKCPYCDFNSHELRAGNALSEEVQQAYLKSLQHDLESALPWVWGRSVHSIFIGGGTPSLFSAQSIDQLLGLLRALLRVDADAEVTLEANPGTFEAQRFKDFRSAGVNRLSIGVQSFNDEHLKALGRVHDATAARQAVALAAEVFPSFNLDLMYGLPNQSLPQLQADLATALSFAPPHLSYYNLTLEPNTYFASHPPPLPDDDSIADMQELIGTEARQAGLAHYEVSAYARTGHRAAHNLNYWQFGDYLGLGAGAHSKLSLHDGVLRQSRFKHPVKYQAQAEHGAAVEDERHLSPDDLVFEFMLNALRLVEGVPSESFAERTGLSIARISATLLKAERRGLLLADTARIAPSPLGLRFLNDLQQMFLA
jgi:putative oxygen-independent coproporphyrinogen III oxidase